MKKFLSVALALAMTLSLVVVGASAKSFTDSSKVNYKEAVDVISACKVVDGYTDGSFNPANTLTRGAAAKIICNMMLGPTAASDLGVSTAPFKDVSTSNVFAGYIAYCAKQGIISCYAYKTFRPACTVSGYQVLYMLLGALGYDSTIEGFTGSNWEVSVAKLASSLGLYDGNDSFVGTKALTREEACLYAYNTLTSDLVEYENKGTQITINGITIAQGASKATVVTSAKDSNTIYDETTDTPSATNPDIVQFAERYFPSLQLVGNMDSVGRSANKWIYGNTTIGTYTTKAATLTYTTTVTSADMTTNLKNYTFASTAKSYINGYDNGAISTPAGVAALTGKGKTVEIYATGTVINRVVVVNTYIAKVSGVDATAKKNTYTVYTSTGVKTMKTENGYGTYAKDAYVVVTPVFSAASTINTAADPAEVTAATKVSGTVTYVSNAGSSLSIDGKTYKTAANAATADGAAYTFGTGMVSKTVDLYTDANGFVLFGTEASSTANYIFVIKSWSAKDTFGNDVIYVQGVTSDGKINVYPVTKDTEGQAKVGDDFINASASPAVGPVMLSYTMDGSKIKLTKADDQGNFVDTVDLTNAIASTDKAVNGNQYYASDVKFVMVNGTGSDAVASLANGAQAMATTYKAFAVHTDDKGGETNSTVSYVFVYGTSAVSAKDLMFIGAGSKAGTNANGDVYNTYINGEAKAVNVKGNENAVNAFYTYAVDSKNVYTVNKVTTAGVYTDKVVSNMYGNLVSLTGGFTNYDAASAKVIDLTDNNITTLDGLKTLFNSGAAVKVSAAYNETAKTVSCIYITDATALVAGTNASATVTVSGMTAAKASSIAYSVATSSSDSTVVTSGTATNLTTASATSLTFTAGASLITGNVITITVTTVDGNVLTATATV